MAAIKRWDIPEEEIGNGTYLAYYDPILDGYRAVGGTKDMPFPETPYADVDTTTSSQSYVKTRKPGMAEPGDLSIDANFRVGTFWRLRGLKETRVTYTWRIVMPQFFEQPYVEFDAWIKDVVPNSPMEELVMTTLTLAQTGEPSWGKLNEWE